MDPPSRSRSIAGLVDDVGRAGQDRAHRRAEALGETRHDRRDRGREPGRGDTGDDLGVEEPGPVHVDGEASGRGDDGLDGVEAPGDSPRGHVGLLDADDPGLGVVVRGRLDGPRSMSATAMVPSVSSTGWIWIPALAATAAAS